MRVRVNTDLIKKEILNRYKPFIKKDNDRIATATIYMFASEMEIHPRTVFNILEGNMSLSMLFKVMRTLELTPDQVFIYEEIEEENTED